MAKINILAAVITSTLPKKDGGTYTKHTQEATIETKSCRMTTDLDVERPERAWPVGVYDCDIEAQLKPGRFGLELPRYLKLSPAKA